MDYTEVSVAGSTLRVPSAEVNGKTIIVTGGWLKIAAIKGEDWEEAESGPIAHQFLANVEQQRDLRADILTFAQKPNDPIPRFHFYYEWDSVAAIPIVSFSDWWTNRVSTDLRRDVRRAAKRGVVVQLVSFTDDLVRAIMNIYDETPIRQGRPFWHYKKSFDAVKLANATYLERSDFLGAFVGDELVGFLKIVYVNSLARLMQIISKEACRDRRPMNALIAKAVEVCSARGSSHLTYGKFRYPQGVDSLTAFKQRNGFQEILVPKYYVPLTAKGKVALLFRLQGGARALMPNPLLRSARRLRTVIYEYSKVTWKAS